MEVNLLADGIVVHQRCFILFLFFLHGLFVRVAFADVDFHRNLLQIAQGVEYLADKDDGLHAEVGQETDGYQGQQSRQTWCAHETFNLLTDGQSVVATGVVACAVEEWGEELGKRYRAPYHDDCQAHEPLEQLDLVGTYQTQRNQENVHGNQEGCQTEAALDEEPCRPCAHTTAGVLEFMVLV